MFCAITHVRPIFRLAVAFGVLASLAAATAVGANAAGPVRVELNFGPPIVLHGACPTFDLQLTAATDREVAKEFFADGQLARIITTGSLTVTFENLTTGKTVIENLSGPGTQTFNPDGSSTLVIEGLNAGWIGDLVTSGRIVLTLAADGTVTSYSAVPHSASLCALLS